MNVKLFAKLSAVWTALSFGQATKANSLPVTLASDQPAVKTFGGGEYETVAAGQTDQALGATGATGDFLDTLVIVPGTLAAGTVSIKDGAGSAINVFIAGTLADLKPIVIKLGIISTGGAWKVTTGTNVTAIATGDFT